MCRLRNWIHWVTHVFLVFFSCRVAYASGAASYIKGGRVCGPDSPLSQTAASPANEMGKQIIADDRQILGCFKGLAPESVIVGKRLCPSAFK